MPPVFGQMLGRADLMRQIGRLDQVAGIALGAYLDGPERDVRYLDLRSGSGLELRVLVDRGFDIGTLSIDGLPLGWRSPNGFRSPFLHHDDEDHGTGLLRSLDGFMVTCGLDHVRGAAEGPGTHFGPRRAVHRYPLHGRVSQTPAHLVGYGEHWGGDACTLWCEGVVRQAMLYGEVLELQRRIEVELGSSAVKIRDRIGNAGFRATPSVQLYHLNFGFPFLDDGVEVSLPGAEGDTVTALRRVPAGVSDEAADEVFEIAHRASDEPLRQALIVNPSLGGGVAVALSWTAQTLPCLQVWRHRGPGMNVLAIEPATNIAAPRGTLEAASAIRMLQAGETVEHMIRIEIHRGRDALAAVSRAA